MQIFKPPGSLPLNYMYYGQFISEFQIDSHNFKNSLRLCCITVPVSGLRLVYRHKNKFRTQIFPEVYNTYLQFYNSTIDAGMSREVSIPGPLAAKPVGEFGASAGRLEGELSGMFDTMTARTTAKKDHPTAKRLAGIAPSPYCDTMSDIMPDKNKHRHRNGTE